MFCPHCGVQVADDAAYCQKCGKPLQTAAPSYQNQPGASAYQNAQPASTPPPTPPVYQNQPQYAQQPPLVQFSQPAMAPVQVYAGFWLRFVAIFIDGLILGLAGAVVGAIFGDGTGVDLLTFLFGWMYFAVLESSPQQATLGKQALGLIVTDLNGQQLTFGRATGRYFGKLVSAITLLIGYIMAGFTQKKQALHDMMAGTLVIRKAALPLVQQPPTSF